MVLHCSQVQSMEHNCLVRRCLQVPMKQLQVVPTTLGQGVLKTQAQPTTQGQEVLTMLVPEGQKRLVQLMRQVRTRQVQRCWQVPKE